jgi:ubiquinone/menaquinone biosynthesis C-methylase UbiE
MSQITAIRAYFDARADEYTQERARQHSFRSQRDLVLGMLEGVSGRIADLGCGPAVMAEDLLGRGFDVWGVDASEQMIERGAARMQEHPLAARLRLGVGDVERLDFPTGFFDAVLAMGVLEYFTDYRAALAEVHRVLRPGGLAVLTVPNQHSAYHLVRSPAVALRNAVKRALGRAVNEEAFVTNRCVPWQLDRDLGTAGFLKLESRGCNFIFYPLHETHPALSLAINRRLTALREPPAWLGTQYVVKAQKRK